MLSWQKWSFKIIELTVFLQLLPQNVYKPTLSIENQFARNFHSHAITIIYGHSFHDCTASVTCIVCSWNYFVLFFLTLHCIYRSSLKPDIVEWKIKKLLRNFEGSNGSISKKLWGLKVEIVSYKKERVYSYLSRQKWATTTFSDDYARISITIYASYISCHKKYKFVLEIILICNFVTLD